MTHGNGDQQLVEAVLLASGGTHAELDERYLLNAFVVHRAGGPASTPMVVELLDRGPDRHGSRWQAMAWEESNGSATKLGQGATAEGALASLDWQSLD